MHYTKRALLVFGLGLLLAFGAIVAAVDSIERLAAAVIAAGLLFIPLALALDLGRSLGLPGLAVWRRPAARGKRKPAPRRRRSAQKAPARRR